MYYIINKKIDEIWDNACIAHDIKLFIEAGRCYDDSVSTTSKHCETKIFMNATILNFKFNIPSDRWIVATNDHLEFLGKGKEIYEEMFIDRLVISSTCQAYHRNIWIDDSSMDIIEFDDLDAGLLYFNLIN